MTETGNWLKGKEVHFRLTTNDLLENDKVSKTAFGFVSSDETIIKDMKITTKKYTEYTPSSFSSKIWSKVTGKDAVKKKDPSIVVFVQEKDASVSADDHRYIEWLIKEKKEYPKVYVIPEEDTEKKKDEKIHLLSDKEIKKLKNSFWKRQFKKFMAVPAKISKDAIIATIPRTLIPIILIALLAYVTKDEAKLERVFAYAGVSIGFAFGFALIIQTILNWMTFWSEFTREAFDPQISSLENWLNKKEELLSKSKSFFGKKITAFNMAIARNITGLLRFISARGDVLIASPLLGIGCVYIARAALGPMGQTESVFTMYGFLLVLANVVVGSIASGPYSQIIAHLRSVGKITNKASTYLGILDSIRLEFGRVADFGFQVLYNVTQVILGTFFWILLLISDRLFPKHKLIRLTSTEKLTLIKDVINKLKK